MKNPFFKFALMVIAMTALQSGVSAQQNGIRLGDFDGDQSHTVFDLVKVINHLDGSVPLPAAQVPVADLDADGDVDQVDVDLLADAILGAFVPPLLELARIVETSPEDGENGVAVSRETIVRLSAPLADAAAVTAGTFVATFAGETLATTVRVSPDRKILTLFYSAPLPPSAQVRVSLHGDTLLAESGLALDADGDGLPGGIAEFDFDTLSLTTLAGTAVCGRVFASEPDLSNGGQMVNRPLEGVTITVDGREDTLRAVTDDMGNFRLEPAPAGRFFVHIDGRTSTDPMIPAGGYYPFVGKSWESVPGEETNIGSVYLPLVIGGSLITVSENNDTPISFPDEITDAFPELMGTTLNVPAGSLFADDGTPGGRVGIAPVDPERLPGQLPAGLNFPLIITVQTDGATNFDEPVPVCFPNLPDPVTGVLLAPGEKSALWSFNHDTGRFEVVGSMTVSADGLLVCSDPGVGIRAPGWHGTRPGAGGSGGDIVSDTEGPGEGGEGEIDPNSQPDDRPGYDPNAGPPGSADAPSPGDVANEQRRDGTDIPPASPFPKCGESKPAKVGEFGGKTGEVGKMTAEPAKDPRPSSPEGDPVNYHNGEFTHSVVDLQIKGRGLDFVWQRKYRSRLGRNSAQGNGWDFSYNAFVFRDGEDLVLCDGNARVDRFVREISTGGWGRPDCFIACGIVASGGYVVDFEDGGRWRFHPIVANWPTSGKLSSIIDRNGNTLRLFYNPSGKLTFVRDTLGRDITIAYTPDGHIQSVTDFTGRSVTYQYVTSAADPAGNPGDLIAVTSPAVNGTPNGNDFPSGKTTKYTYSKHATQVALKSNLLTITDGRRNDPADPTFGQGPYLVNTYATTTDKGDIRFDRVVRQQWGDTGDVVDFSYRARLQYGNLSGDLIVRTAGGLLPRGVNVKALALSASSTSALTVAGSPSGRGRFNYGPVISDTIVNDRSGNVTSYHYDGANRLMMKREHTGRANPDQPTTSLLAGAGGNRPVNKLRAGDPDYFETRYTYNADYLLSEVVYPDKNAIRYVYEGDLNPSAPRRARANVRQIRKVAGSRRSGISDQQELVETYEYDPRFSACGSCGLSFVSRHVDARGNVTLHTYDDNGNRTRTVHRVASVIENFEYNQFGQLTAIVHPDNGSGHRRRDEFDYYGSGIQAGYMAAKVVDVGGLELTTNYGYDAVGNRVMMTDARGNTAEQIYNELDQVVRRISREVSPGSGIVYQVDQFFDANNNVVSVDVQNLDENGVLGANPNFTTSWDFETLNFPVRMTREVDAGRSIVTEFAYDANRNRIETRKGEATNGNQLENTLSRVYDERDLLLVETLAPGHLDQSTTLYGYDLNGSLAVIEQGTEDALGIRVTEFAYDGFDRLISTVDAMGNTVLTSYDPNGNVTRSRVLGELVDVPGTGSNLRMDDTTYTYDALDRLTRSQRSFFDTATQIALDDGASATTIVYSDNSQPLTTSDDNGHTTTFIYDTANRLAVAVDPKGNSVARIYDANSNVIASLSVEKDDLGGSDQQFTTTAVYDGLDRKISSTDNRGNTNLAKFDSRRNLKESTDALGNRVQHSYDGLNRLLTTTRILTDDGLGSGAVTGQIVTQKVWDDSNRLIQQIDPNGNATTTSYDPLGRTVGMAYADQTGKTFMYDVHHNVVDTSDANGNSITATYDLLNRVVSRAIAPGAGVANDSTAESYVYDGKSRLVLANDDDSSVGRAYDSLDNIIVETLDGQLTEGSFDGVGNRVSCTYPGGRIVTCDFDELNRKSTIAGVVDFSYVGSGRIARRDYANGTRTDLTYDGITGQSNPAGDFGVKHVVRTRHTRTSSGAVIADDSYTWDQMGNKKSRSSNAFSYDSAYRLTASGATTYPMDEAHNRTGAGYSQSGAFPIPADSQLNQYTSTPAGARSHDLNGNVTSDAAGRTFTYDFANRMVGFDDGSVLAGYRYDALGRRVEKNVNGVQTLYFYCGGDQVCEEQDGSNATTATYVYGLYIDDVVQMQRGGDDFYYHCDDLYSTVAMTDGSGATVESFDYADYGQPSSVSSVGNPYLFTGRRYDPETGFYYYRTRYLDPGAGRFTTRDTIGIWGDPTEFGNGYTYVGNNPWSRVDPLGMGPGFGNWLSYRGARNFVSGLANVGTVVTGSTILVVGMWLGAPVAIVGGAGLAVVGGLGFGDNLAEADNTYAGRQADRPLLGQAISGTGVVSERNADIAAKVAGVFANVGPGLVTKTQADVFTRMDTTMAVNELSGTDSWLDMGLDGLTELSWIVEDIVYWEPWGTAKPGVCPVPTTIPSGSE